MNIENLIKKIQGLINHRSMGVVEKETKETYQIIRFRDTFRHKYNAVFFHFNILRQIKREVEEIITKGVHGNKDFLISGKYVREKRAFANQIQFKSTVILEDIIYHLVSIFDNLPKIISVYHKTVQPNITFRSAKNQLNQEHTKNLEITKLINDNWEWIEKIKDFRAQIFHHHSKNCTCLMKGSFWVDKDKKEHITEEIVVKVPYELRDALGLWKEDVQAEDENVEIEKFSKLLIDKSFSFFDKLFDLLTEEHKKYIANKN